jgi:hypothetical protein
MSFWRRRLSGRVIRRAGIALLWMLLLLGGAVAANLLGIRVLGSLGEWAQWLDAHAGYFQVWRLLLYVGIVRGWLWMRQRLLTREPGDETRSRLMRIELAAIAAVAVLEGSLLLQGR